MNWLRQNWRPIVGLAALVLPSALLWVDVVYGSRKANALLLLVIGGTCLAIQAPRKTAMKVAVAIAYPILMGGWLFLLALSLVCGYHRSCL